MGASKVTGSKINAIDQMGNTKMTIPRIVALVVFLGALIALPHFLKNAQLIMMSRIFLLAVYGMSYDILRGYTGFINLGQSIFFGSGVYMGVIYLNKTNNLLHFVYAILAITVFSIIGGFIMSKIVLRTGGVVAAAMITLALAEIVRNLAERFRNITGGQDGLPLGSSRVALDPLFNTRIGAYYFTLVFLIVMTILLRQFVLSPTGRVLLSIRENEQRSRFLGFNTDQYKTIAIIVSSVASGWTGTFFAVIARFANTDYLSVQYTLNALLITLVGGTGTLYGAIIGSAFVTWIQSFLLDLAKIYKDVQIFRFPMIFIGCIYIILVMFMPSGIMGGVYRLQAYLKDRKEKAKAKINA